MNVYIYNVSLCKIDLVYFILTAGWNCEGEILGD